MGKSNTFFTWMVSCHAIIVGIAVICEKLFAYQFANKFFYQDLTLEFKGISHLYDTEEKVLTLFNELSSNNVKEISLIYDLNEYFSLKYKLEKIEVTSVKKAKIVSLGDSPQLQLAKEMINDRINHFKVHFVRFKQAYFQQRGFVTFSNPKIAFEMKEIYKKAIGEESKGFLNGLIKRFRPVREKESPARIKFRNIVFQKIMKPRMAKSGKQLSSLIGVLFGGKNNIFLNKVTLMRAEVGPEVGRL